MPFEIAGAAITQLPIPKSPAALEAAGLRE
jgi:hypothetical protein